MLFRIRGELPQFKRCCMCLPLRHGLIVWGYMRLVIGVILLVGVTKDFFEMLAKSKKEVGYEIYVVKFGFFVILEGVDIVLNVVFVYAGHTKDLKMLKAYYIYSFVLWILMIIMGISLAVYAVHVMKKYKMDFFRVLIVLFDVTAFLAQILIQAYILLLVRSELIKLTNNCEFRFVNKATESTCKMKCEEDRIPNDDTVNGHVIINITDSVANDIYKNETSQRHIFKELEMGKLMAAKRTCEKRVTIL